MIALDPGTDNAGTAKFHGDTLIEVRGWLKGTSRELATYLSGNDLVVEIPQIYTRGKSKGDPNDLVKLAFFAGLVCEPWSNITLYKPGDWAGRIPKATTRKLAGISPRAKRIRSRLSISEQTLVDWTCDDQIDAVGLGLHHLGRFKPKKIYPGAT